MHVYVIKAERNSEWADTNSAQGDCRNSTFMGTKFLRLYIMHCL